MARVWPIYTGVARRSVRFGSTADLGEPPPTPPKIDVIWNDIPDPRTPLGLRGIGEIGITGVGAAVANAVFNATGKRIRDLPITLDKLI
jgi:CO/xanthine dehydrogenase Mo-binding subunit